MLARSFPPIADARARVLVLGSMPGAASLAAGEYYAHPRNAFWPIMGELFGAGPELPYEERRERLMAAGVAVWDVLKSCRRVGSLDTAIERDSEEANDFAQFFQDNSAVRLVAFNGQKAETAFKRHALRTLDDATRERLTFVRLPSTSPAHAGRSLAAKLEAWRAGLGSGERAT
ncbi:DNA-deoxyinosine glycosylase [Botrimarina mediterranea]|uniref:Uracil DNA glycosylase superfamily protein n=1 Tax=Botrimarina mediterranea TaxID=2528022 RepID=A0A518KEC1_9BACT|nr:DNA-deoxyinosine glycosylase [Botrimarina mediterranea]QDV76144.1 Uracil DNA glycosylase superfamily protein [Botrimarina mediterranea]QDV80741.1 Uracil DNA glycosylase superfamily protein [Planctomycetes bacterium K2D]